jgi:hypothetical protein
MVEAKGGRNEYYTCNGIIDSLIVVSVQNRWPKS